MYAEVIIALGHLSLYHFLENLTYLSDAQRKPGNSSVSVRLELQRGAGHPKVMAVEVGRPRRNW